MPGSSQIYQGPEPLHSWTVLASVCLLGVASPFISLHSSLAKVPLPLDYTYLLELLPIRRTTSITTSAAMLGVPPKAQYFPKREVVQFVKQLLDIFPDIDSEYAEALIKA